MALGQQGSPFPHPEEWSEPKCFRIWESRCPLFSAVGPSFLLWCSRKCPTHCSMDLQPKYPRPLPSDGAGQLGPGWLLTVWAWLTLCLDFPFPLLVTKGVPDFPPSLDEWKT